MDEAFRILAREREADFEREAQKRRLAAQVGPTPKTTRTRPPACRRRRGVLFFIRPREA